MQAQYPHSLYKAPKPSQRQEPTDAELLEFGRTVFADMTRLNELSLETARVRNHMAQTVNSLTYRLEPGLAEPCPACNYDICQCERLS